jgi:hypothetical protein
MGFRQQCRRLLVTSAAAVVTLPLSLMTPLSPGSPDIAAGSPRTPVPAVAPPTLDAPSGLDMKSAGSVFVRERGGPAPNAEKAHFATDSAVHGQFPVTDDNRVVGVALMAQSGDSGRDAKWHRSDVPIKTASLDGGGALTAAGDADAEAGSTTAPEIVPDDSWNRVACHRAARYRADVDTAFHVPIRDRTQETDA